MIIMMVIIIVIIIITIAIPMVTMAQSAANWRNTHSHGSHAFTHTLYINTVTTTLVLESKRVS